MVLGTPLSADDDIIHPFLYSKIELKKNFQKNYSANYANVNQIISVVRTIN